MVYHAVTNTFCWRRALSRDLSSMWDSHSEARSACEPLFRVVCALAEMDGPLTQDHKQLSQRKDSDDEFQHHERFDGSCSCCLLSTTHHTLILSDTTSTMSITTSETKLSRILDEQDRVDTEGQAQIWIVTLLRTAVEWGINEGTVRSTSDVGFLKKKERARKREREHHYVSVAGRGLYCRDA